MSLTLYDATIPVYLRILRNLDAMLDKAVAHAETEKLDLAALSEARLFPDMFPLTRQVQSASDAAKGGAARLAGVTPPSYADTETTFPELKERIAKTIAFVETVTPDQVNGDLERPIELKFPTHTMTFTAKDFVFQFSLPNFLFHVSTAYAILRSQGVPLGKLDYLAGATFR